MTKFTIPWLGIVCFSFVTAVHGQERAGGFLGFGSGRCVLHYVSEPSRIQRFDICTNQEMPDFNTAQLPDPRGIQQVQALSDGGLLVANVSVIARFRDDGRLGRIYDLPGEDCWSGIALERDEQAFWASSSCRSGVTRFDLRTESRMFGGGTLFASTGMQVSYGMDLHCDASIRPNYLQLALGNGEIFVLEAMNSASCTGARSHIHSGAGTGTIGGRRNASVEWTFLDAGEPGVDKDRVRIVVKDGAGHPVLEVSGAISAGTHIFR